MNRYMCAITLFLAAIIGFASCGDEDAATGQRTDSELKPITVGAEGGSQTIAVTTPSEWSAFASNNENWISVSPSSGKAGNVEITVSIDANKETKSREGQVTVKAGSNRQYISISQAAAEPAPVVEIKETEPVNLDCPIEGYKLAWHDEFQSEEINSNDWKFEVKGDHWVNNELQNYVREYSPKGEKVALQKNGLLRINCFKEEGKVYSARLYAKQNSGWQYGYVEASIMLPSGKGTWPAFWMMPVHFTSWPHDGEIDIMEEVGYHRDYVSSSLHADGHVHSNNTQVTKEVYCKGAEGEFHKYGMEWTKDYFQFYVDGKPTLRYDNPGTGVVDWPYDAPFYVILNLAWGGDWGGSQGVNESALPISMYVDYVRVWQK